MNKKEREKRERNKKDKEWKKKVKENWKECVVCGDKYKLNAHHIIPKEVKDFRWDIDNGIAVCATHHKWSREISAHKNPFIFYKFLETNEKAKEQLSRLLKKYNKKANEQLSRLLNKYYNKQENDNNN